MPEEAKTVANFAKVIQEHASICRCFEQFEEKYQGIGRGDQKTGVIGEFYAFLYLKATFPEGNVALAGNSSVKGWDLKYNNDGKEIKVQVKTVSEFSRSRTISPIHAGWNRLFLIFLNNDLQPAGFWIHEDSSIVSDGASLRGFKMRDPRNIKSGSALLSFKTDLVEDMKEVLQGAMPMKLMPVDNSRASQCRPCTLPTAAR